MGVYAYINPVQKRQIRKVKGNMSIYITIWENLGVESGVSS